MKKFTPFLISCLLVFGAAACDNPEKTTADAPSSTNETVKPSEPQATEAALNDAQSKTRRDQLNADIRAREQRNNTFNEGKAANRSADDLESQVRSKLEANIPNGNLTVEAEDNGAVTVAGTVINQAQLDKIEPLAKEIKGVTSVVNKATVAKSKS